MPGRQHTPPPEPVRLLTVRQVAASLNFSEATIWELVRTGRLRSVKEGWARRVPVAAVDEYVKTLETEAAGGAA